MKHKATSFVLGDLFNQTKKLKLKVINLRKYQERLDNMLRLDNSFVSVCWARRLGS